MEEHYGKTRFLIKKRSPYTDHLTKISFPWSFPCFSHGWFIESQLIAPENFTAFQEVWRPSPQTFSLAQQPLSSLKIFERKFATCSIGRKSSWTSGRRLEKGLVDLIIEQLSKAETKYVSFSKEMESAQNERALREWNYFWVFWMRKEGKTTYANPNGGRRIFAVKSTIIFLLWLSMLKRREAWLISRSSTANLFGKIVHTRNGDFVQSSFFKINSFRLSGYGRINWKNSRAYFVSTCPAVFIRSSFRRVIAKS